MPRVNILLLLPEEIDPQGQARLTGRRARHVHTVLRAEVGQELAAGELGGGLGTARILAIGPEELLLHTQFAPGAEGPRDILLLAVPRPKVLLRMLAHAAAFGFGRIVLFRSWRTEKSHLASTAMDPAVQREHLLLGLEQAGRTCLPAVQFFPLFKPMVEDSLDHLELPAQRFLAHPRAAVPTHSLQLAPRTSFALALGPDGGFLPYEVEQLQTHGFCAVQCGPHPLRTESALSVLWGQLDLLRRRGNLPK